MDIVTYALCRGYVKKTADALGAVKGANCRIKSIVHKDGINTVTFQWTGTSGAVEERDMVVYDGTPIYVWESGDTYHYGDLCIYASCFYRCITENSDTEFDSTKWNEIGSSDGNYDIVENADLLPVRFTAADRKIYYSIADSCFYLWNGTEWVDITGSATAEDVAYTNTAYPDVDNVKEALDTVIDESDYVAPQILSFRSTLPKSKYEIGQSVAHALFSWTLNKAVTMQSLTDCTVTAVSRSAGSSSALTETKTFTLTVSDGKNTDTAECTIPFLNKIYWGSATEPTDYDSAFVLALSGSSLTSNCIGAYKFAVDSGEYGYFAMPKGMAVSAVYVNSLMAELEFVEDISFTNSSGYTTTYSILRFPRASLGSFTAEIRKPADVVPNRSKITLIRLNESLEDTSDVYYYETFVHVRTFLENHSSSLYRVVIGEDIQTQVLTASDLGNMTNIVYADMPSTFVELKANAFYGCTALKEINVPENVVAIYDSVFNNCTSLEKAKLPTGTSLVGQSAFYNCAKLTEVNLPQAISAVMLTSFYGCSSLTHIEIPSSVTAILNSAFQNCTSLISVKFEEGVQSIGLEAFCGCSSLTSVAMPKSLRSIARYAFSDCSSLVSIVLNQGLAQIAEYAFKGTKISTITIPSSVVSIASGVFDNCSQLTAIILEENANINSVLINYNSWSETQTPNYEVRVHNMPTATSNYIDLPLRYVGETTSEFANGKNYKAVSDGTSYVWQEVE